MMEDSLTNTRALAALIGLVFFLSACAPEPLPFSYGRWESSGGEYFIEVTDSDEPAAFRLPLDPEDERSFGCAGDLPGPSEGASEWHLSNKPAQDHIIIEITGAHGGLATIYGLYTERQGDWAVLEVIACGGDYPYVELHKVVP